MKEQVGISDALSYMTRMRRKITALIEKKDYENALLTISCLAEILYKYNQSYTDFEIEEKLVNIQKLIDTEKPETKEFDASRAIVFYDGFGLDLRGLALIYLSALAKTKYKLFYIVHAKRKNKIPTIISLLKRYNATIVYVPQLSIVDEYRYLVKVLHKIRPFAGFLYTTPNDISGTMAFMEGKGKFSRYQINLTDHAFWIGKHAFDFCLEFRDYGADVSYYYRGVPKEAIIKLPYYPYIDSKKEFEGFPFSTSEDDFIIFSGGSLYKTFDGENNLYYTIVDFCLNAYPQVKFWYAGTGDDRELRKLKDKYQNRVFYTAERRDLYQILKHVDLYLNTYPIGGGLMMQYAAVAGKVPLTLRLQDGNSHGGILNCDRRLYEFDSLDEIENEIRKLITDSTYRIEKGIQLKSSVISQQDFEEAIVCILEKHMSSFQIDYQKPDTIAFRQTYLKNFDITDCEKILAKPQYFRLFKFFPDMFMKGMAVRGGYSPQGEIQVSVIVISYNSSWERMKRTLCSVLLQENINFEIIVSDDGSEENFFQQIEQLFSSFKFERFILLASKKNNGTCANYYRAISCASGKYIKGFGPGDCLYDATTLAKFYEYAEKHFLDICFGNAVYYSQDERGFQSYCVQTQPRSLKFYDLNYRSIDARKHFQRLSYLIMNDFICGTSFFFTTELIIRYVIRIVGNVKYAEDNCIRLMVLDGVELYHYNEDIVWYEYGTGISTQNSKKWSALLKKDLYETNKIIWQCKELAEWFPIRYRLFLLLKQNKLLSFLLFPKTIVYKYHKFFRPVYTKQLDKTEFYKKIV